MFGTVSDSMEVKVPASEAWKLYGTLELAKIVPEALPNMVSKIDVVQGEGGVGTILELFFLPGRKDMTSYKEKCTVVDDEKRVKETEVLEGGFLDLGFTLYRVRYEVIENEEKVCVTRVTIEYEVREEFAANVALVYSTYRCYYGGRCSSLDSKQPQLIDVGRPVRKLYYIFPPSHFNHRFGLMHIIEKINKYV